jgi:hypothetical protein
MIGIFSGLQARANLSCMKVWTNIRESIIFLQAMKLPERTDLVTTLWRCKRSLEGAGFMISSLIPIFSLTNFENSKPIMRCLHRKSRRRIFGLSSQQISVEVVVFIFSTILKICSMMIFQLFQGTLRIHFSSTATSLICAFMYSLPHMSHWECMFTRRV